MCKLCCLNCKSFAHWDGDYCCVDKMTILSYGDDDTGFPLNPEKLTKWRLCTGFRLENKRVREMNWYIANHRRDKIKSKNKQS